MRSITLLAVILSAAVATGCSGAQFNQLNMTVAQAQTGAAIQLATSATIAQMALIHMAAALSQVASQDLNDGSVPPQTGAPRPDAEFRYELDNKAGTGKVIRSGGGKSTVDLSFTFESERGSAGMAYTVTGTTGHFEGYQLLFPRLTLLFSAILGDNFLPKKHENGNFLFNVDIDAVGSIGVNGAEVTRLSRAKFGLSYPISEGESRVGELQAVSLNGNTFDGEVIMASKALKLQGTIKSPSGASLYELRSNASGGVSLSKAMNQEQPPSAPTNAISTQQRN